MISSLVSETRDHEIRRLFRVANALHINFCENWDNAANVSSALDGVERYLNGLEPLATISHKGRMICQPYHAFITMP